MGRTQRHSWAPVDKALSVFLPLEPLTRPKRSRKLHVGTQMNPAHVTCEDEWDSEGTDGTCMHTHINSTSADSNNTDQKKLSTAYTWAVRIGKFKGTDEGWSVCSCACASTCTVCVGVWFLFP